MQFNNKVYTNILRRDLAQKLLSIVLYCCFILAIYKLKFFSLSFAREIGFCYFATVKKKCDLIKIHKQFHYKDKCTSILFVILLVYCPDMYFL